MDGLNEFLNLDWEAAEAMLEQLIKRERLREPATRSSRRDGGRIELTGNELRLICRAYAALRLRWESGG
jgi:hypothetical protein